jgi:hypothetical protein
MPPSAEGGCPTRQGDGSSVFAKTQMSKNRGHLTKPSLKRGYGSEEPGVILKNGGDKNQKNFDL